MIKFILPFLLVGCTVSNAPGPVADEPLGGSGGVGGSGGSDLGGFGGEPEGSGGEGGSVEVDCCPTVPEMPEDTYCPLGEPLIWSENFGWFCYTYKAELIKHQCCEDTEDCVAMWGPDFSIGWGEDYGWVCLPEGT